MSDTQEFNSLNTAKNAAAMFFASDSMATAVAYQMNINGTRFVVWIDRELVAWDRNPADAERGVA